MTPEATSRAAALHSRNERPMIKTLTLSAIAALSLGASATAAFADGDAAAGEGLWRNCRSCHSITDDAGATVQRGGRTGPNLWGVPGRQVASLDGFRYSDGLQRMGADGTVWTEELFVAYVANPTEFLRSHLNDTSVRSPMTYRLASGANDMWAYLVSVSPEVADDE